MPCSVLRYHHVYSRSAPSSCKDKPLTHTSPSDLVELEFDLTREELDLVEQSSI
uniref:Uncharacterized protein n=1 Tax=Arundo donax TaxID=35708 RepID=A0A0A8XXS4_ARUDO